MFRLSLPPSSQALDPDRSGFCEADKISELLTSSGTPFRDKELSSFLAAARDPESGRVRAICAG